MGRSGSFRGIQHSKALVLGGFFAHGAGNWTTASRGNKEICSLTWLNPAGVVAITDALRTIEEEAAPYHEAVRDSAEQRAAARAAQ